MGILHRCERAGYRRGEERAEYRRGIARMEGVLRMLEARLSVFKEPFSIVLALLLVASIVLCVLDRFLPFPSPAEKVLYDSSDWSMLFGRPESRSPREVIPQASVAQPVGGYSSVQPAVSFLLYRVKPGDTLTGVAQKLGMNTDTISSLNRTDGRGVHNLTVGETIRIPSQDGIYLTVNGNLEEISRKNGISIEDVLAANSIARDDLTQGMRLFFPGVQHKGSELSLSLGIAVANPLRVGWESSRFGYRDDPFSGERRKHRGVDIAAAYGSAVRSASDGVVRIAAEDEVLGNYIEVKGPRGYSYVYGHLSQIWVRQGSIVSQGDKIGAVGATGRATGPHLHFEVRWNGVPQDPALFVSGIR